MRFDTGSHGPLANTEARTAGHLAGIASPEGLKHRNACGEALRAAASPAQIKGNHVCRFNDSPLKTARRKRPHSISLSPPKIRALVEARRMAALFAGTFYWIALADTAVSAHRLALTLTAERATSPIVTIDEVLTGYLTFFSSAPAPSRSEAAEVVEDLLTSSSVRVIPRSR